MLKNLLPVGLLSLLLGGCAMTSLSDHSRVPPESRAEPPGSSSSGRYQPPKITPYREPVIPEHARPQPARAVQALVARAQRQQQDGELVAAASSLERALRIEPKNARLWNRLAHVRYKQKRYALAASLAAKSNALAGTDSTLRTDNDDLIRRARSR